MTTTPKPYIGLGRDGLPLDEGWLSSRMGPDEKYVILKTFSIRADPNSDGLLFKEGTEIVPACFAQDIVQVRYDSIGTAVHVDTLKQYPNTRL